MIPWFPGGHADPWNHVEAAMALDLGGRTAEAERAYEWLVDLQRPDGSWHQYYLADARSSRTSSTPTSCAYVAAGVWHHWLLTGDRGFLEAHVAGRRAGHRLRARPADARAARSSGPATPTARRGRSPCSPARRASATASAAPSPWPSTLGHERPDWELSAARLAHVIRCDDARRVRPEAPLGDGLVLPGARPASSPATPAASASTRGATPS